LLIEGVFFKLSDYFQSVESPSELYEAQVAFIFAVAICQELQSIQDQTFISALSRLEAYAHDKLLLKLTSRTTVDFEKPMSPDSITIFLVPKADLGENLARLNASTICHEVLV